MPSIYKDWYEQNYPELTGHGLWLRGGEINTLPSNGETSFRPFKVLFARLSTYFDTGYSFTHQYLYQVAAHTPGVLPDLAYLPPKQDARLFARDQIPWLLGTNTKLPATEFDLIGFSNSIVQELINLPAFLRNSGIPLSKKERLERADLPLLILGGANALYSSCVWYEPGPFVDGVFVGESDLALRRILEICRDGKLKKKSKVEVLKELEEIPGFFQPENPRSTKKSFIPNLNQSEALESGPVYYIDDQLGNSHLQISEGCPCFCSFCAESWDRKPYRERKAPQLKEIALRAKAAMGLDRIDIYSFNFNMHSDLYQILWDLVPHFRGVGLKSQRFDLLAHDPEMVEFQHAIEKASITCGLEGISPRIRKYLHKNLENEQLHKSLEAIFKSKARSLKVFLIATGLEQEQDFAALSDFLEHLDEIRGKHDRRARVVFSMTPLVRFPWTPLEFENAYECSHYEKIIAETARRVRRAGFEFRESAELPEYWTSQVLIRASNPKITAALTEATQKTDFIYYREVTEDFKTVFEYSLKAQELNPSDLLKGFTLEESASKPWALIETGVDRKFLWEEVERARAYTEIDYCLGRSWTKAECFHCGGCPTRFHVRDIVLAKQPRNYTLDQFKARVTAARNDEIEVKFQVRIGKSARGVPRKMFAVALARAMMLADSRLAVGYRGTIARGDTIPNSDEDWLIGTAVVSLVWNAASMERLMSLIPTPSFLKRVNENLGEWGELFNVASDHLMTNVIEIKSPFPFSGDSYFKARGLKYTLRKTSPNTYRYEFVKESKKKGIILELDVSTGSGVSVTLRPGPKFNAGEFAREAFKFSRSTDWVRLEMVQKDQIGKEGTGISAHHALPLPPDQINKFKDLRV